MDSVDINILLADNDIAMGVIMWYMLNKTQRKRRICDARNILKKRKTQGYYNNLIAEMRLNDRESFKNFHRMTPKVFDDLLYIIGPMIQKDAGLTLNPITAGERLSLTLR